MDSLTTHSLSFEMSQIVNYLVREMKVDISDCMQQQKTAFPHEDSHVSLSPASVLSVESKKTERK